MNPTTTTARSIDANFSTSARQMLEALDSQFPPIYERRKIARHRFEAVATFTVESVAGRPVCLVEPQAQVLVRDANSWALGYITNVHIASHAKGRVTMTGPDGQTFESGCLVRRTREFAPGWFQGVLEFDLQQQLFSEEALATAKAA